jgi:serine/threonine-protein kinase
VGVMDDLYERLEVSPRASEGVIDAAFKALMKRQHPDHGASVHGSRAVKLNEARATLLDPDRRAKYDRERNELEGTVIGGFRVEEAIAEGGFGKTYKGRHILVGSPVCIKHCSQISAADATILTEEAKAMWDLRHYAIPAVRNMIKLDDGSLALVMSYIPGLTLEQIVEKLNAQRRKFDAEHAAWIMERLLNGLSYMHRHGIIHGDIKPQNIIIQPESHTAVLVDFGLSAIKPTRNTGSKGYTDLFAPPEQRRGMPLIPQIDFYSLAVTMLFVLNGGDAHRTAGRQVPAHVPDPICAFLRRMLVRDPLSRPDWQNEDLMETVRKAREESFGRVHSGMKPLL